MRTSTSLPKVLLVLVFCLAALGAPTAQAAITGIADENLEDWSGQAWAAFGATGVHQVRHIVPWDVAWKDSSGNFVHPAAVQEVDNWIKAANAHGLQVLISFNPADGSTSPPTPASYQDGVAYFHQTFPSVTEFTAWNEPNHTMTGGPYTQPALAAEYWAVLHGVCPSCTIAAGDFNDDPNLGSYLDSYKAKLAALGASPSIWAIHPYNAVKTGNASNVNGNFMDKTSGQVWFSEIGALLCTTTGYAAGDKAASEASQKAGVEYLRNVLIPAMGSRLTRTYYYSLAGRATSTQESCGSKGPWDSNLMRSNNTPRPAFVAAFPGVLQAPAVNTWQAWGVGSTEAHLSGGVDPRGFQTSYYFQYGTTSNYGSQTAETDGGFNAGGVTHDAFVTGLQPGTTYHYRVVAVNPGGASYGNDQTFTTQAAPEAVTAFQANTGILWIYPYAASAGFSTGLGMANGTSPSVAGLAGGAYIAAFQSNAGELWAYSSALGKGFNTELSMAGGTSPSATPLPDGSGYLVAYQSSYGELCIYSSATGTAVNTHQQVTAGTNPAITAWSNGAYYVAFQRSGDHDLGIYSSLTGTALDTNLPMSTNTSPSIASWWQGRQDVAFRGGNGHLWVYSSASGMGKDTFQSVTAGTNPAITALSGAYSIAFSNGNELWHYSSATGGANNSHLGIWSGTSPGITTRTASTYISTFQANTTSLWTYSSLTGTGTGTVLGMKPGTNPSVGAVPPKEAIYTPADGWHYESLGAVAASDPDISSWGPGRLDVFAEGTDAGLWHNYYPGPTWAGWGPLGGSLISGPSATAWTEGGTSGIDAVARNSAGMITHWAWRTGLGWTSENLVGNIVGDPDISSWGSKRFDLFARSNTNTLLHRYWDGTKWNPWEDLGGSVASGPAAVSWGPGRIDVVYREPNNTIAHVWSANSGASWSSENLGGVLSSDPDISSWGTGNLDVFARGSDGGLWHRYTRGAGWADWDSLGGSLVGGPGAVSWGPGRIDVVWRQAGSNSIGHTWWAE